MSFSISTSNEPADGCRPPTTTELARCRRRSWIARPLGDDVPRIGPQEVVHLPSMASSWLSGEHRHRKPFYPKASMPSTRSARRRQQRPVSRFFVFRVGPKRDTAITGPAE